MDLFRPETIKELCQKYHIYPSRLNGQNFLINQTVLNTILESANISNQDTILEVGPGFGVLTIELAKRAKKVIAVEQDNFLADALTEILKENNITNVEIIRGNALRLDIQDLKLGEYRIISNLPYQITSHFLRVFLESENKPSDMVLMLQKEVAERICAKPKDMSLLSVSVQFYAEPKIESLVLKNSFWPIPKVDSAIINIKTKSESEMNGLLKQIDASYFFKVAKNGFLHRRQKLLNNLTNSFHLEKSILINKFKELGISDNARAQELTMDQWVNITKILLTLK